jgi:hypothetical protein
VDVECLAIGLSLFLDSPACFEKDQRRARAGDDRLRAMPDTCLQESDLVPLSVAASLAYFELAGIGSPAGSEEHLRDVLELAVVALSQVAPIHWAGGEGGAGMSVMSGAQVEKLLFAPIRQGRPSPDLGRFYIRRSDLHAAIMSLRSARNARR